MNPLVHLAMLARMRRRARDERRRRQALEEARARASDLACARVQDAAIELRAVLTGAGFTAEEIEAHVRSFVMGRPLVVAGVAERRRVEMSEPGGILGAGRRCACCGRLVTDRGEERGVTAIEGCEWLVRAWVRDPASAHAMAARLAMRAWQGRRGRGA